LAAGRWLRQSGTAYIYFNAGHILAIGVLLGSILLLDPGCWVRSAATRSRRSARRWRPPP
jgi:hypothetical protein